MWSIIAWRDIGINTKINPYDEICPQWDEYRKKTSVNKCIADFSRRLKPNSSILDVGCGTGYPIDFFLSERGFRITGIDSSAKMIEKAASLKLKNSEYHVAELFGFRTEEKFDAIIAFDCLWHICHDNQKYIYGTIASLIKKGGYFIFTHGKKDGEIYGEMMGQTFYYSALDAEEVKKILISEGFEIISFTENYKERTTGDRELLVEARKL